MRERDEFYVGYLPAAPAGIGRFVRARAFALLVLIAAIGGVLAAAQGAPAVKSWEFGKARTFVGVAETSPAPTLLVRRPGDAPDGEAYSRYLLVAEGKHGAAGEVGAFAGRLVQLRGTLLYREGHTMIEVVTGSVSALGPSTAEGDVPALGAPQDLGRHTLVGEIVDSKCYLGAMEPGDSKAHRDCAVRCISGGIPPVFLVRERDGRALYFLLVSADGRAVNREVLPYVAEPLEITGAVEKLGDQLVLKADPSAWRRVKS